MLFGKARVKLPRNCLWALNPNGLRFSRGGGFTSQRSGRNGRFLMYGSCRSVRRLGNSFWPCAIRLASSLLGCFIGLVGIPSCSEVHGVDPIQPGSWTLAVLPDTQIYAESFPEVFAAQTQFLVDHADALNIQFVLHEGDVTNNNSSVQWSHSLTAMSALDGVLPYAIAPGNHDYGPGGNAANRNSLHNDPSFFGSGSSYAAQPSLRGFFEANRTDNSYHTFRAGGNDWLVLSLEWGPRNEVVEWANQVAANHPGHLAMLATHAYMYNDDTRYDWETKGSSQSWNPHSYPLAQLPGETINDGEQLWSKLVSQHENFRFVFSGHVLGDGAGFLSSEGVHGNVVHQMLANYQMKPQGGQGDMRLLEFLPDGETVVVRTYSPTLDRYDVVYDQEFTLHLNQLRDPPAQPPYQAPATALGALLRVEGATAPAANIVGAIKVSQASPPGMSVLQANRGDFQITVGGVGAEYQRGVMLATISQNVRDGMRSTVEVGRNSFGDGILSLSTTRAGTPGAQEVNFDVAVAWFEFAAGWQAAHVNAGGGIAVNASNGVTQEMLTSDGLGRYSLDLGVNSQSDGLLFAVGNNNSNVVVQTSVKQSGAGWNLRVQNNASGLGSSGLNAVFSFIYLPYDTRGLIGGLYDGVAGAHLSSAGDFTMTRLSAGAYELTIPGETPETGMLNLTVAHERTENAVSGPDDNVLSYEATSTGGFLIHSVDLPGLTLEDTGFAWAFINFQNPISPIPEPSSAVQLLLIALSLAATNPSRCLRRRRLLRCSSPASGGRW